MKATADLQGALFSFLCTLTIEIRNHRHGPLGSRREVLWWSYSQRHTRGSGRPAQDAKRRGGNCHPHWLDGREGKAVAGTQRDGGWSCMRDCGLSRMLSANSRVHRSGRREWAWNRPTSLFPASTLLPGQLLAKPNRKPEGVCFRVGSGTPGTKQDGKGWPAGSGGAENKPAPNNGGGKPPRFQQAGHYLHRHSHFWDWVKIQVHQAEPDGTQASGHLRGVGPPSSLLTTSGLLPQLKDVPTLRGHCKWAHSVQHGMGVSKTALWSSPLQTLHQRRIPGFIGRASSSCLCAVRGQPGLGRWWGAAACCRISNMCFYFSSRPMSVFQAAGHS